MSRPRVYLAGKISGISYDRATGWRQEITQMLEPDIECLNPMRHKEALAGDPCLARSNYSAGGVLTSAQGIIMRDLTDVRRADMLIVHFGELENTGFFTAYEMGMATALGKPIIVIADIDNPTRDRIVMQSGPLLVMVEEIPEAVTLARSVFNV